ncbi:uncharacterized protein LOC114527634 [Dendronephthya gigantea]|uniref:uncharacterized protein LOC114527634 n=1 Tax=Dendronephthya gigantea TaxID=151771 RepID=UPI00106BE7E7|nr:uncharacterized protein LOC114527634 [Dendronephthya gigantea]
MAESSSTSYAGQAAQNVEKGVCGVSLAYEKLPKGRKIIFKVSTTNIRVAKELCKLAGLVVVGSVAISLGALYVYAKIQPLLQKAINNTFGVENVEKIIPNCLYVTLRCSTDEIFLKILEDYNSGRIRERLKDEVSQVGIEVEGLMVEIENIEEVNKTKEEIYKMRKAVTMTEGEEKTTKESYSPAAGDGERELSTSDKEEIFGNYKEMAGHEAMTRRSSSDSKNGKHQTRESK